MLSYDPAFYSFKIIHFKTFNIEHHRYSSFLTQLLPLLAIKKGFSLELFLKLYSISFILLFYLVFNICVYLYKNLSAGISILLALCLCIRQTFYSPVSEFQQGMVFVVLYWCIISSFSDTQKSKDQVNHLINFSVLAIITFFHPLLLTALIYISGFELIKRNRIFDKNIYIGLLLIGVCFGLRLLLVPVDSYESNKIPGIAEALKLLLQLPYLVSTKYFLGYAYSNYKVSFLAFFIACLFFSYRKQYKQLIWCTLATLSYIALICIIYHNGESHIMYENYFLLVGLFIAVPLSSTLIENKLIKLYSFLILLFILTMNFYNVWKEHLFYSQRISYIDRLTSYGKKFDTRKFIVNENNSPREILSVDWAFAFESLLHSSIKGPDSAVTVYTATDVNAYDSLNKDLNLFLGADFALTWFKINDLDTNYFRFKKSYYKKLNLCSDSIDIKKLTEALNIQFKTKNISVNGYSFITVPVTLSTSSEFISSCNKSNPTLFLSYRLYKNNGEILIKEGRRTPLEVDLYKGRPYSQGLVVDYPGKDSYILEAYFTNSSGEKPNNQSRCYLTIK